MAVIPLGAGAAAFGVAPASTSLEAAAADFAGIAPTLAQKQEDNRLTIAVIIVVSLAVIVTAPFLIILFTTCKIDDLIKLVQATIGPVIGVVGAVTGFYFGTRENNTKEQE